MSCLLYTSLSSRTSWGVGSCRQAEYSIPSSQSREYCALCRVLSLIHISYSIIDVDTEVSDGVVDDIKDIDGVTRVRVIK